MALKSSAGILANEPEIARVLTFDPYFWRQRLGMLNPRAWREASTFLRGLQSQRYDLAVSISGDIASILARLSGARRRVGYAEEAYPYLLTDPVPGGRYRSRMHEVRYVLALARAAGAEVSPSDARLSLRVDRASAGRVATMLAEARSSSRRQGPVVTVHSGAQNGQAKRWPTSHIAALATRLAHELDALVLLTGAPGEMPLAEAVERQSSGDVVNLCGKTSLSELAALLAIAARCTSPARSERRWWRCTGRPIRRSAGRPIQARLCCGCRCGARRATTPARRQSAASAIPSV